MAATGAAWQAIPAARLYHVPSGEEYGLDDHQFDYGHLGESSATELGFYPSGGVGA